MNEYVRAITNAERMHRLVINAFLSFNISHQNIETIPAYNNITCTTFIWRCVHDAKGIALIFWMKLFKNSSKESKAIPIHFAMPGIKLNTQRNISPNNSRLDKGTARRLATTNKFGNWWKW